MADLEPKERSLLRMQYLEGVDIPTLARWYSLTEAEVRQILRAAGIRTNPERKDSPKGTR